MALNNTAWPSIGSPPVGVTKWLSSFFALADTNEPEIPQQMAALFSEDCVTKNGASKLNGQEEFKNARKKAWDVIVKRKHEVYSVYTAASDYSDILLIGKLSAGLKNGKDFTVEFSARVKFADISEEAPKVSLYEVWTDSAPMKAALAAA